MYLRIIFNLLLIFLLVVIQQAFIPVLPFDLNYLNLSLVSLIFVLISVDFDWTLIWWLTTAWLLDLFSFYPFGSHLLIFGLILLIIRWLLINYFTNRSLYSFLFLVIIATVLHDFGLHLANYLFSLASDTKIISIETGWWLIELKRLLFNSGLTIIFFYLLNFLNHRFRPNFLSKS